MAILLVFLVHYNALFHFLLQGKPSQWQLSNFLIDIGQSGVDIFFVLSGFLIYAAVLKPTFRWGSFARRRIRRIYPTFLIVLSLYLLLSFVFTSHSKLPAASSSLAWYLLENLLLLPGFFAIQPIVTVSWSLSYELVFYLFIATFAALMDLSKWDRAARLWMIAATLALFVCAYHTGHGGCIRLVMFVAGIALYETIGSRRLLRKVSPAMEIMALLLFVAAIILSGVAPSLGMRTAMLFVGILPLMAVSLQSQSWITRLLCWSPLRHWGKISYSYYLIHGLILWALRIALAPFLHYAFWFWALLPVVLLVTLAGSLVLYFAVEKPLSLLPSSGKTEGWPLSRQPDLLRPFRHWRPAFALPFKEPEAVGDLAKVGQEA